MRERERERVTMGRTMAGQNIPAISPVYPGSITFSKKKLFSF